MTQSKWFWHYDLPTRPPERTGLSPYPFVYLNSVSIMSIIVIPSVSARDLAVLELRLIGGRRS
jgi:hypothetical protein